MTIASHRKRGEAACGDSSSSSSSKTTPLSSVTSPLHKNGGRQQQQQLTSSLRSPFLSRYYGKKNSNIGSSNSNSSSGNNKNWMTRAQRKRVLLSLAFVIPMIWLLDNRISGFWAGSSMQEILQLQLQQQEQRRQQQLMDEPVNETKCVSPMCVDTDPAVTNAAGVVTTTTLPANNQAKGPRAVAVYLVTRNYYINQLYKTLQYLDKNWLRKYPMPIVFFYSGVDPAFIIETAQKAMTNNTLNGGIVKLITVELHRTQPPFFNRTSVQQCLCCCNGLPKKDKIHKGALRGGQYHPDYCYMNRFRTYEMYRHPALKHYDYFVQMDTDTRVMLPLPYDPVRMMQKRGSVYGFAWAGVRKPNHDCNKGLFPGIAAWAHRNRVVPKHRPQRGEFWSGSFNMGRLDFFRSKQYYRFANWINNRATGVWTARWGDEIFLPHIISMYHGPANISHFYKWHRNKVIVHKSKSVGRKKQKPAAVAAAAATG